MDWIGHVRYINIPKWLRCFQTKLQQATSELAFASVSKRVFLRNYSYGNEFRLNIHFHANQTKTRFESEAAQGNSEMADFVCHFCPSIPRGEQDTKKTPPNMKVCPKSLGAMLEYRYVERGLLPVIT